MQCHKRGHRAPARCVSALLAAGALLAAAADSLGGTSQRPAIQDAALSIPPALTAASVSALLAERDAHVAGSVPTDPGTRPEPTDLYASGGPLRPSSGMFDPSPATTDSPQPVERTRRATKKKSRSTNRNRNRNRSKAKGPARRQGTSHSRSADRSRPARHAGSYSLEHLPPAKSKKAAAAVHEALSLLGVPYRWGGTTRAGFDCSGFTQHVWAAAGVKIPRTVRAQARAGTHISLNNAQPGDLVVFYPTQHHVGIYVGNGLVIDSPHTGATVRPDPVRSMPVSVVVRVTA